MTASEAFSIFAKRNLESSKAKRLTSLASSKKGQRKLLDALSHDLESVIRIDAICDRDYRELWNHPCYVFHDSLDFGATFATLREAYDKLTAQDSWLIIFHDASAGIYRPEARWDDEKLIGR